MKNSLLGIIMMVIFAGLAHVQAQDATETPQPEQFAPIVAPNINLLIGQKGMGGDEAPTFCNVANPYNLAEEALLICKNLPEMRGVEGFIQAGNVYLLNEEISFYLSGLKLNQDIAECEVKLSINNSGMMSVRFYCFSMASDTDPVETQWIDLGQIILSEQVSSN